MCLILVLFVRHFQSRLQSVDFTISLWYFPIEHLNLMWRPHEMEGECEWGWNNTYKIVLGSEADNSMLNSGRAKHGGEIQSRCESYSDRICSQTINDTSDCVGGEAPWNVFRPASPQPITDWLSWSIKIVRWVGQRPYKRIVTRTHVWLIRYIVQRSCLVCALEIRG